MNVGDLVEATRRALFGSHRGQVNFIASDIDDLTDTVVFADEPRGVVAGAILGVGLEIMYVRSANTGTKTATVVRGWLGSTAVDHFANEPVEISPRWTRFEILNTLQDEIRSWGSGVFRVDSQDVSLGVSQRSIDLGYLDNQWTQVLSVQALTRSGADADRALSFRTVRSSPSYPLGAIVVNEPIAEGIVTVTVALPFDLSVWEEDIDLEETVGLVPSMFDIPPVGAAWRLMSPREITRLDPGAQGEPRSAAEVQGGMIAATARHYKLQRDQRLQEEAVRLRGLYPWRI
jgi:hypothetical protein